MQPKILSWHQALEAEIIELKIDLRPSLGGTDPPPRRSAAPKQAEQSVDKDMQQAEAEAGKTGDP